MKKNELPKYSQFDVWYINISFNQLLILDRNRRKL